MEYNASLFAEEIPRSIIVGLVANKSLIGNPATSPFKFEPFGLREISMNAGGRQYPQVCIGNLLFIFRL
jgi:hypothetical protein